MGGPPMLNRLCIDKGVFIVGLIVHVEGKRNNHCVIFSASKGMLMDNCSNTCSVYVEETDKCNKKATKIPSGFSLHRKYPKGGYFQLKELE
jgi:hypothetical protein